MNSNNFPPTTEEVLGPNNLNIEKKTITKINCVKYFIYFILKS